MTGNSRQVHQPGRSSVTSTCWILSRIGPSIPLLYGPIMSLRLGQVSAVVVSSPEAAELFLKTHDVVFASRPKLLASEFLPYGSKGMAFSEYGPYWRTMRKLCTSQLFSAFKVEIFSPIP